MPKIFTRAQLYDLVWTQPRTALAKELGVSDVAIGKHCVQACIPAPPAGHWARLAAGKVSSRPPLPIRLPGQGDELALGVPDRRYLTADVEVGQTLTPPHFTEDIEAQVNAAMKLIGQVSARRDLADPDVALRQLLRSESRRSEKQQRYGSPFYAPYFDAPRHQRQLRILSSLSRAFGRVNMKAHVFSNDEWVQGVGTLHRLALRVQFGGAYGELEFLEPGEPRRARQDKGVASTTLRIGTEGSPLGMQEWVDSTGRKLEAKLEEIVRGLLHRAEASLRLQAQYTFERRVELQKELADQAETRKRETERKRLEAVAAHRERVRNEVIELANQHRTANDIRGMLLLLARHPDLVGSEVDAFERWRLEANAVADMLDPLKRPLNDLFPTFAAGRRVDRDDD